MTQINDVIGYEVRGGDITLHSIKDVVGDASVIGFDIYGHDHPKRTWAESEVTRLKAIKPPPAPAGPAPWQVDHERDRRLGEGTTFTFEGHVFQFDPGSRGNIADAASAAAIAMLIDGAQPGDLYWNDPEAPFAFVTRSNGRVLMDAPTVIRFGQHATSHKSKIVLAARALKDLAPIPTNFRDPKWWP